MKNRPTETSIIFCVCYVGLTLILFLQIGTELDKKIILN